MVKKLAAVVLNYNDPITTEKLIISLKQYKVVKKIAVVDNCSTDNSYEKLSKYNDNKVVVIKSDKNGGYGYGNNYGILYLISSFSPTHILILNPDVVVQEYVIERMLEVFEEDKEVAVVAPFMLNREGRKVLGTAWRLSSKFEYIFSSELLCSHYLKLTCYKGIDNINDRTKMEVDCVAGSLLMVDAYLMQKYGMYDERIFLFGEETVLACKIKKAGYKTILLLQDCFLHLHGVSIDKNIESKVQKRELLLKSHYYILNYYLGANKIELLLAKAVYLFSMIEFRVLLLKNKFFK